MRSAARRFSYKGGNASFNGTLGPWAHTRASTTLTVDSAGYYQQVATGVAAYDTNGLRVTPQLVNKCQCYGLINADSTGYTAGGDASFVMSIFDDSASVDGGTRKLSAILNTGKVLKLDNSGGATAGTVTIAGTTGNVNAHSYGVTHRGGTGTISLGTNSTVIASAANYTYLTANNKTPSATNNQIVISVDAGQTMFVILPGLYETTVAPLYPVVANSTSGSTTRAQVTASIPLAPNFRQASFMVTAHVTPDFALANIANSTAVAIVTLTSGTAANLLYFYKDGSGNGFLQSTDGVNTATVAWTPVAGTTYKIGVRGNTVLNQLQVSVNGANGTATAYDGGITADGQNKIYIQGIAGGASIKNLKISADRGAAALAAATT